MGGVDLRRDLNAGDGDLPMPYARSHIVAASVAAGLAPPIDSVYAKVADTDGLRAQAEHARSLGFAGKSAIHPRQVPVLHDAFSPDDHEVACRPRASRPRTGRGIRRGPVAMSTSRQARATSDAVDRAPTRRRFCLARDVLAQASADRYRAVRKMRQWPGRSPADARISAEQTGHAAH
jgi:hypothetical protein